MMGMVKSAMDSTGLSVGTTARQPHGHLVPPHGSPLQVCPRRAHSTVRKGRTLRCREWERLAQGPRAGVLRLGFKARSDPLSTDGTFVLKN